MAEQNQNNKLICRRVGISKQQALLIGLIAALGSVITVVRRHVMLNMDPWRYEIIAALVHVSLIPILLILVDPPGSQEQTACSMWWAVLAAFLNVTCAVAFSWSLRGEVQVGVVSTLTSLSSVLTMALAAAALGEIPSLRQVAGIILAISGAILAASK